MSELDQIEIEQTVSHIRRLANIIRQADGLTIVLGAGTSITGNIPSGPDIVNIIKKNPRFIHRLEELQEDNQWDYGLVMQRLSPIERKKLFEGLIENSVVNWGHLALASIMKHLNDQRCGDSCTDVRVLSFNFDFLLERSAALVGHHFPVYDFGAAPTVRVSALADHALFHLHGQSQGLTLKNANVETKEHLAQLRPLIQHTFAPDDNRPIIVIGYSGGSDPAFTLMKEIYQGDCDLFWLGYAEQPLDELEPIFGPEHSTYVGGCDFDQTMIELARELDCWPPAFMENPIQNVVDQLSKLPEYPNEGLQGPAIGSKLSEELTKVGEEVRDSEGFQGWSRIVEWMRLGHLPLSVDEASDTGSAQSDGFLKAWDFISKGNKLAAHGQKTAQAASFEMAAREYEKAVKSDPRRHEAFNNWGTVLLDLARLDDDRALFEASFEKYSRAVEIKPDDHEAFYNWGNALSDLANLDGDRALFEASFEKYGRAVKFKPDKHEAFNNWGNALSNLARLDGDRALFEASFEKYAHAVEIKPDDHQAFYNWGNALSDLARLDGDRALFEASLEKYGRAMEIKPDDHKCFNNWGTALSGLAKLDGDRALYEASLKKYGRALEIKPDNFNAGFNLACCYALLGEAEKCREQLEELEGRHKGRLDLADEDFDSVREMDWFQGMLSRQE